MPLLLVAMPFVTSKPMFLFCVLFLSWPPKALSLRTACQQTDNSLFAPASLFLVVRPGAPSSVLAPSSDARSPK